MRMKFSVATFVLLMTLSLCLTAMGQGSPPSGSNDQSNKKKDQSSASQTSPDQQAEGVDRGNYHISQSLELGYRFSSTGGNERMFDSLVNLHQGFRVLSQTLSLRSLDHSGALFDNLYVSSYGWNGDPTNAARFDVSKNKYFKFSGNFRRDQNFFDYDLLVNPLNPPVTNGYSVTNSPHSMELRRRMTDLALTLAPQSPVSVRLGYVHNNMTGPSFSSFHEGTDVLLLQPWNTTLNGYRIGVDFKVLPKTIISYDQFLDYFKNDTDQSLAPFPLNPATGTVFTTATGIPVSLGLPFQPSAGIPCATPFLPYPNVNPACSVYQSYSRAQRYRSRQPSEQLLLQGNYGRIDLVGRIIYASNKATDDYNAANGFGESFLGVVVRTGVNERAFTLNGLSSSRRVSTTIDLGATIHLSDTWRIPLTFRSENFRTPGFVDLTDAVFSPTTAATIGGPVGTAVVTSDTAAFALNRKDKLFQAELEHDFAKSFGARLGLRWTRRETLNFDFSEAQPDTTQVNEYTGLGGIWYRGSAWRANLDVEAGSADNFLYRISPRHQQRYRLRIAYNPKPWAVATAYANVWQGTNGDVAIDFKGRNRNYGVDLNLTPNGRYGLDFGYNFNLYSQNSFVCFTGSLLPPGTTAVAATDPCATADEPLPSRVYTFYNDHNHDVSATVYFQPMPRVTANFGYALNHSDGNFTLFNGLQPLGQVNGNYHQPLANLAIQLHKNLFWNLGWNYWGYRDQNLLAGGSAAPTLPRNFHTNVGTVSLRFAF